MRKLVIISSLLLCLVACAPGHNDYSDFRNIDVAGWAYGDTLTFIPSLGDSIVAGDLMIALRHSNSYLYRNLWLEVSYQDGNRAVVDTLNVEMADVYGHWYGSGFGARYQISNMVKENVTIERNVPILVRHIMRVDTLNGIEQVGLTFRPNN